MNIGKYSTILVSVLLAGILIGTVGIPIIDGIANDTNTVSNSGAQWVRMAYVTDDSDYSFTVHMNDNDTVTITNGEDVQTGPADDIILYADELHTVFIKDGVLCTLGENSVGDISGGPIDEGYDLTVKRVSGAVSMTARFGASWGTPTWAYVPISGANYASFDADAVPLHKTSSELAVNGAFAGVYANHVGVWDVGYDFGLVIDADVTADYINSVQWVQESELADELEVPFNPDDIIPITPGDIINPYQPGIIDPLNPGEIEPIDTFDPVDIPSQYVIMGVPTPTYTDGDWGYELDGTNATIVSYSGVGGITVTIPATIGGYDVVAVGKGTGGFQYIQVFDSNLNLTGLTISSGITTINDYAFYGCNKISGPLTLPSTITTIGESAFGMCSNLTSTSLDLSNVVNLESNAFYNCSKLTGTLTLCPTMTTIGYQAFYGCTGLTGTVTIPSGITSLPYGLFWGCDHVTSFVLHSGITKIQPENVNYTYGTFHNCSAWVGTLDLSNVTVLGSGAFYGCSGLTGTVTIPSAITTIGNYTFYGCSGLTGIVFHNSMTAINQHAFDGCSGLTSLTLPTGLTQISNYAFYQCTGMRGNLEIPSGVTTIGQNAFSRCGFDGTLTIPNTVTTIQKAAFAGCSNLTGTLNIPNITSIPEDCFALCSGFTGTLNIPVSCASIGDSAFFGCSGFTGGLTIPSGVTTISKGAFASCTGFTGLYLSDGLTTIANIYPTLSETGAFENCTGMTGILVLPSSLTTIGYRSFKDTGFSSLVVLSDATPSEYSDPTGNVFDGTNISEVLNLSSNEWTTTSYGLDAEEVSDHIDADNYLAIVSYSETVQKTGPVYDLVNLLPIVMTAGLLIACVWYFTRK